MVSLPPTTRFTVGHTFVRLQIYTFSQERGNQAGIRLGAAMLHITVSLSGSGKEPLFLIPVIPGLGLIIGENGFIPARFLDFPVRDSYSRFCQNPLSQRL